MRPPARRFGALAQPLDEILSTVSRVRVLRALIRNPQFNAASAIAKESRLTLNAVLSALGILAIAGLVREIPVGSRRFYEFNSAHPFARGLDQLFEAERERRQAVRQVVEAWADEHRDALAAWQFGSVSRGDDTFGSDLDLAVVGKTRRIARNLEESLRSELEPVATRLWLRPNVLGYEAAEILAMPASDPAMWRNLVRDATAFHGPKPAALLRTLTHRETGASAP